MAKEPITSNRAPIPLAGYSQAVRAGGMIYVSGQGAVDPATGKIVGETIQEQVAQCLRSVQAILEEAGSSLDKVVWTILSLRHPEDFDGLNEEWARWFPTNPPARHLALMPLPDRLSDFRVSIGAFAEA